MNERYLSHLPLYCHFDSEGDKIREELFKPVWPDRQKEAQIGQTILSWFRHALLLVSTSWNN